MNGEADARFVRGLVLASLAGALLLVPARARAHPDIEFLEQAMQRELAKTPDDPDLLLHQGRLREMAHDWEGALVAFEHAREHGADPAEVAAARGRVFLAAGWSRMALLEFDRLLAMRPDAFEILFARGRAWRSLGHPDEADRDFARAIANMKTPRPEHVFERRDALLARGRRAEAISALDEGIARLGPIASLELAAIALDVELEHYDRALGRIDGLLQQAPGNEAWIALRGDILARSGRAEEARREISRALAQIESRPTQHRNKATQDLEQRLRATLASDAVAPRGNE